MGYWNGKCQNQDQDYHGSSLHSVVFVKQYSEIILLKSQEFRISFDQNLFSHRSRGFFFTKLIHI